MEAGQKTSLQVSLPKGLTKLHLPGEIKWVKQVGQGEKKFYLAGIQFEDQDEKKFKIMDAYLQYLQRGKFIQSQKSVAILHLENLNRVITLEPLNKKGFPDNFNPFDDG